MAEIAIRPNSHFLTFVPDMLDAFQKQLSELVVGSQWSVGAQYPIPNTPHPQFLLAVSGGLDSVVMTELFRVSRYKCSIAHCNFRLRGRESDSDESFVKELAKKFKMPFFSVKFDTVKFCKENKLSIQMGARQLRYDWLEEIRKANNLDYIVTAHHADDAIETFFINLLRGTGISGLHGIKAKNENTIRPLLGFYRNEIENFAKEKKLEWREDSSNSSDKYERNKIRHHLIPMLEEINPKAKESISSTIGNLERTEEIVNSSIKAIKGKYISSKGDSLYIHFDFFKEPNPAAIYLFEVLKEYGFNYEQCLQIAESVKGQSGKVFLSDSHQITVDRGKLIIEKIRRGNTKEIFEIGNDCNELLANNRLYRFETLHKTSSFIIPKETEIAALDFNKLTFPLKIRKWANGDKFYPLGMDKPKKVSDFLIDNKVSLPDKEQVYVLLSGGTIVWLIGQRIDDRFKVTEATKNVYLCKLQKATTL